MQDHFSPALSWWTRDQVTAAPSAWPPNSRISKSSRLLTIVVSRMRLTAALERARNRCFCSSTRILRSKRAQWIRWSISSKTALEPPAWCHCWRASTTPHNTDGNFGTFQALDDSPSVCPVRRRFRLRRKLPQPFHSRLPLPGWCDARCGRLWVALTPLSSPRGGKMWTSARASAIALANPDFLPMRASSSNRPRVFTTVADRASLPSAARHSLPPTTPTSCATPLDTILVGWA